MLSDSTFMISTVWRSIKEWMEEPCVIVQVGFEERYYLLDRDGEIISDNDPIISDSTIMNDEFPEETQRILIDNFMQPSIQAEVIVTEEAIEIISIDGHKIKVSEFELGSNSEIGTKMTVPVKIYHRPDFNLMYLILQNTQNESYQVIDLYSDQTETTVETVQNQRRNPAPIIEPTQPLPSPEEIQDKKKLWDKIHLTALKSESAEAFARFCVWIWDVSRSLECGECKYHMIHYITKNPPQDCTVQERTAFYWSWQFHNSVNEITGKPTYEYEVALEHYLQLL